MKLTTLHEASTMGAYKSIQRAMEILKVVKPNATLEDLTWFACVFEAKGDWDIKDRAYMFLNGMKPLKEPANLENYFENEFEWMDEEYGVEKSNEDMKRRFMAHFSRP